MVNWNEVFYYYLLGNSHITLASKFNIQLNKIRNRAKKEEWLKKRNPLKAKVNNSVDKKLDTLAKRAFSELESIVVDECSSATSRISQMIIFIQ